MSTVSGRHCAEYSVCSRPPAADTYTPAFSRSLRQHSTEKRKQTGCTLHQQMLALAELNSPARTCFKAPRLLQVTSTRSFLWKRKLPYRLSFRVDLCRVLLKAILCSSRVVPDCASVSSLDPAFTSRPTLGDCRQESTRNT